jgi:hypothetical protein
MELVLYRNVGCSYLIDDLLIDSFVARPVTIEIQEAEQGATDRPYHLALYRPVI